MAGQKIPLSRPCLHIGGRKDTIVDFDNQERTMETIRKVNGCAAEGSPWHKGSALNCTLYPSSQGAPFVAALHPGGHFVPDAAGRLIVQFFKEVSK